MAAQKAAGFRCPDPVYEEVKAIAENENRSISNVVLAMVTSSVIRYKREGWKTFSIEEDKNE